MKKIILILVLTVCVAFQVTQLFYFPTIHMAAATGNLSALNRLANRDANRLSHFFYPPLYAAIINNQASAVDILLRNGADPNVICTMRSLLAEAIVRGERHIVLLMLKQGGNVNLKDQYQMTPLHYAITCGDPAVVEALLAHGANVMVPFGEYRNLVDCARYCLDQHKDDSDKEKYKAIVELLEAATNKAQP